MTRHLAKPTAQDPSGATAGRRDRARGRRRRRPRRSWGQRFVIFGGVMSALVLAGSAAGLGLLYRKVASIPRIELSASLDDVPGGGRPQNYLIVGIDSDEGVPEGDPIRAGRAGEENTDTIMVMRIDPSSEKASILSFPRDLWVPYPDGNNHRINQAYVRGGRHPGLLIDILNDYFGIPIHHYVQVDFASFYQLVDAIGGVPVYFPYPAKDDRSGLAVAETGCVTLDRRQAIGYVRSRFYEELRPNPDDPDDPDEADWVFDLSGDLGRIQRQQNFIRRALERAISRGARNPGTLNRLLDVATDSVTIDDELTPGDIFDLGQRFRSFDPTDLENFTVPTVGDQVGAAQILRMVESEAEPILARFRDPVASGPDGDDLVEEGSDDLPAIAPRSVRLTVLNGTGAPGQASETGNALAAIGFDVIGRRDAEGDDLGQPRTVIRYPAGARDQAELVARWLVADAELVEVGTDVSAERAAASIELITGADWAGVRDRARAGSPPGAPGTTSTDDDDLAPTTTSTPSTEAPASTTTTTTTTPHPPC